MLRRPTPYCVSFYNSWDPKSSPTQAHIHIYSNSMTTLKSHRETASMNMCCNFVLGSSIISLPWSHWHWYVLLSNFGKSSNIQNYYFCNKQIKLVVDTCTKTTLKNDKIFDPYYSLSSMLPR